MTLFLYPIAFLSWLWDCSFMDDATWDVAVYGLVDPRTNQVRYIGQSVHAKRRFKQHLGQYSKWRLYDWFKELAAVNLQPELIILERCRLEELTTLEQKHIDEYRAKGAPLLNKAKACDPGYSQNGLDFRIHNTKTGEIFESYAAAGRSCDVTAGTIRYWCDQDCQFKRVPR